VTVVLDSFAVLRYFEDKGPAARAVADLLSGARPLMSWINLGEVHSVLRGARGEGAAVETVRDRRDVIDARLPDERLVLEAARIKADYSMAYADSFAAALAVATGAALWTGYPELLLDGAEWRWHDPRC
jgi:predicted nucleic acid-binding protein